MKRCQPCKGTGFKDLFRLGSPPIRKICPVCGGTGQPKRDKR